MSKWNVFWTEETTYRTTVEADTIESALDAFSMDPDGLYGLKVIGAEVINESVEAYEMPS